MALPDVPRINDAKVYDFLRALKARVENLGPGDINGLAGAVSGMTAGGVVPGGGGSGNNPNEDFSTPPTVDDFDASPGPTFIAVTWTPPAGAAHVTYTEVRRATTTNFADAVFVGTSVTGFLQDNVGRGSPLYQYWARHVRANVNSPVFGPWSGPDSAQTPIELDELLALLEGQINELQLSSGLNDRIDLIDTSGGPTGTGLVASLLAEIANRSDGDSALSAQIETIVVGAGNATFIQASAPTDPPDTINEGDRWLDSDDGNHPYVWHSGAWVDATDMRLTDAVASITDIEAAIVALDGSKAEASDVSALDARVTVSEGDITTLDAQAATAVTAIADLNTNKASVASVTTLAATVTSQGSSITTISGQITTINSAVADLTANKASVTSVTTLAATVAGHSATLVTQNTAIADLNAGKASVSSVTTLQTTVNGHTASIQTNISSIQGLQAEYSVRIDSGGRVVGFGLVGTPTSSQFLVRADLFAVSLPGLTNTVLFAVGTINGVARIILNAPAIMGDASIKNAAIESLVATKLFVTTGTIADAIIGTAQITNAMISNVLQSNDWDPVTHTGWRLTKSLGLFEGRGITIYDNAGNPIFGSGTGFNLNWLNINGTGKPQDNATRGATWGVDIVGQPLLQDAFTSIGKWAIASGVGPLAIVADPTGRYGGSAMEATGALLTYYNELIPFDPNSTYRGRIYVRDMSATGLVAYAGFWCFDAAGNQLGNGVYHFIADGVDPGPSYTEFFGFFKGASGGGSFGGHTLGTPGTAPAGTAYFRPYMYLNWQTGGPTHKMRVSGFIVDKVQEQINGANISTYIASLAVDTLYIANQAVTIPISLSDNSIGASITNTVGVWTQVFSMPVPSTGAPIDLQALVEVENQSANNSTWFRARLRRVNDGFIPIQTYGVRGIAALASSSVPVSLQATDQPGSGTWTYAIDVSPSFTLAALRPVNRALRSLETKR